MIIDFNRNNGGGGGSTPANNKVLKAVTLFPDVMDNGDVVSKIEEELFEWDFSDGTTAKMHIDLDKLDTSKTYTIASFDYWNGAKTDVVLVWNDRDAWACNLYVGDYEIGDEPKVDCYLYPGNYCVLQVINDDKYKYYVSINYIPDDYSGLGGNMIQIGFIEIPENPTKWGGSYEDIPGFETYTITGYTFDGIYHYDATLGEWVKEGEELKDRLDLIEEVAAGGIASNQMDISQVRQELRTATYNMVLTNTTEGLDGTPGVNLHPIFNICAVNQDVYDYLLDQDLLDYSTFYVIDNTIDDEIEEPER